MGDKHGGSNTEVSQLVT